MILLDLKKNAEMDDLMAELELLREQNALLKSKSAKPTGLKVSEKGAISVYGLGRFPVTLYKSQMLKFLDMAETIREFIKDNEADLTTKV